MANGLLTNSELIDSVLDDLNSLLREHARGQYVTASCIVSTMANKLVNLRNTIDNDLKNREQTIENLKTALRNAGQIVQDFTPEELIKGIAVNEGEENGSH